ncbi:MAG: Brp/Blh family beta-carotene 15,15'-dioxygenase [Croceivirga sp.]
MSTQISPQVQDYLAYGLILTFGVLHGANDITLISSLSNKNPTRKLLGMYLGAMGLVTFFFLISRGFALVFFILISAYHFGEQHLGSRMEYPSRYRHALFLCYGLVILFLIFNLKLNETIAIISDASGWVFANEVFQSILIVALVGLLIIAFKMVREKELRINVIKELFYLMVLAIVFANSSLVWGFAIYFILWHSIPSLYDQIGVLYGKATKYTFIAYLKSSYIYWLISILGLLVLYGLLKDRVDFFITVVLYVLAAITFPHVMVMSKLERLKK